MLKGKTILLGITGGIAAYKSASLASLLVKHGATVHVIMTADATNFIHPITFESLTQNKCLVDTFDRNFTFETEHISLAKKADAFIVAPATANIIAKLSCGIADDMLTTTFLACKCPKIIAPAMNTAMYENAVTQDNITRLRSYGMEIVSPAYGRLACGDTGAGKMPEAEVLLQYVLKSCALPQDMKGLHILVTAGPTQEAIDPVRYITNHSSGKMGYSIASICTLRGADVTLVSGQTSLEAPLFVNTLPVVSAQDMFDAVVSQSSQADIIIKAAAVADYRPAHIADEKVKKADSELSIALERTDDILQYLGEHKTAKQFLCGFSMETENMVENSRKKLQKKHLDMIVANNLKESGAGFGGDTNIVTLITPDSERQLAQMSKEDVASELMDEILKRRQGISLH